MSRSRKTHELPRLRELRERAGLSQRGLAELANVGRDTIHNLEHGRAAHARTTEALAGALGVPEEDLKGRPGFPTAQVTSFLNSLAEEEKTLYDAETAGMTDEELAAHVRRNPTLRRIVGAIISADEERERLEAESRRDAS